MPNYIPQASGASPSIITADRSTESSPLSQHTTTCTNSVAAMASIHVSLMPFEYKIKRDVDGNVVGLLMGSFTTNETAFPEKEDIIELTKIMWQREEFHSIAWEALFRYAAEEKYGANDLFPPDINELKSPCYGHKIDDISSAIIKLSRYIFDTQPSAGRDKLEKFINSFSTLNKNGAPWFAKRIIFCEKKR